MTINENQKISIEQLYVVVRYDYFGEPSCDDYVYYSKEEAQKTADKINQKHPILKYGVTDLQDYIWENRSYNPCDESEFK